MGMFQQLRLGFTSDLPTIQTESAPRNRAFLYGGTQLSWDFTNNLQLLAQLRPAFRVGALLYLASRDCPSSKLRAVVE
jgi:hypothetical protein